MKAPERIETARLTLTPPTIRDAAAIFEYASDPDVVRYMGWPRHLSLADTEAFVEFGATEWARWPAGPYSIWSREDGRLVGGTGFGFDTHDRAATGYVLAKDAWGRGYATEATKAIVAIAREIGVVRLYALCHPDNRASWRVLEKAGFARDVTWTGQLEFPNLAPGVAQDVLCYAVSFP